MKVNGVAVMCRKRDGWLNATQILKVAGLGVVGRTGVLEQVAQEGRHEEIYGGYEEYQDTWIDNDRGRALCAQYNVEQMLPSLLNARWAMV